MKLLQEFAPIPTGATAGAIMGFQIKFLPQYDLLLFLGITILLDCTSAFIRARQVNAVQAGKLIQTGYKMAIYAIIITSVEIMVHTLAKTHDEPKFNYSIITNTTIALLIFIEIYSSFKHIQKAFPHAVFTKYVVTPFINMLQGRFNKGPIKNPFK